MSDLPLAELIQWIEREAASCDRENARLRGNGMFETAALTRSKAVGLRKAAEIVHEFQLQHARKEAGGE